MNCKIIVGTMTEKHWDGVSIDGTRYTFHSQTDYAGDIADMMFMKPCDEIKILLGEHGYVNLIMLVKEGVTNE